MNRDLCLAKVRRTRVTHSFGLSLLLVTALAARAEAQTILIDDFNDGVADGWTTIDTTVGRPWGPGTFDASSGAFHLEGAGLVPFRSVGALITEWDQSSNPIFADGFVRATIRTHEAGDGVGIVFRSRPGNSYLFFGNNFDNRFRFNSLVNGSCVRCTDMPRTPTFGINEDWNIEAGAVDDQLSMKVWRMGDPEPESPQWTFRDRSLTNGRFGIAAFVDNRFPQPSRVSATVDDIYFRFPPHDDPFTLAPYDIYLWESPMPVPQVEGPFFVPGSPEKPDMRDDVTAADDWPDLRISGQVTDVDGEPIPGLKLDFWQVDDQGSYDNSGGFDLRGHIFTDEQGNYELWSVMPANYESIRTRHLHAKIGGENLDFDSWAYTTQFYFPEPYDNDIDGNGTPDKVIEGGVLTDLDAIALQDDRVTAADLTSVGAEFSDLVANILTVNNNPLVDGYFDTTLDIVMPSVFQAPLVGDYNRDGQLDASDLDLQTAAIQINNPAFDLDGDGDTDFDDRMAWVRDLKETWIGDANLDGEFNSGDLITVFQEGKFESDEPATWAQGDWNADGLFNSTDFIAAFQDGGYEVGTRTAVTSVPEPSSGVLLGLALFGILGQFRKSI